MEHWWGFRPCTPDLKPIIGKSKIENLFIFLILINLFPKEDQQDQLQHHLKFYFHHLEAYLLEQFSREQVQEM